MEKTTIGFTSFMDFCIRKSTQAKITKAKELKYRDDYHPALDFWKQLRDRIVDMHRNNHSGDYLDHLINEITDRKLSQYTSAIKGYKKFLKSLKSKTIVPYDVDKSFWVHKDLTVQSTPEIGLIIDGVPHRIKLYFKEYKERIDIRNAELLLTLMEESVHKSIVPNEKQAILKVHTGKLIFPTKKSTTTAILTLKMEAENFTNIYNNI